MEQTLMDKLTILADSAKYDVACTSSGASRTARAGILGSCYAPGCCHAFTADGRCVSLLKVLMTNCCAFDCSYCVNRKSNDIPRATFTPRELAELTVEFYRRNYIEGLFLSSAVLGTPDYTTERMLAALRLLRRGVLVQLLGDGVHRLLQLLHLALDSAHIVLADVLCAELPLKVRKQFFRQIKGVRVQQAPLLGAFGAEAEFGGLAVDDLCQEHRCRCRAYLTFFHNPHYKPAPCFGLEDCVSWIVMKKGLLIVMGMISFRAA